MNAKLSSAFAKPGQAVHRLASTPAGSFTTRSRLGNRRRSRRPCRGRLPAAVTLGCRPSRPPCCSRFLSQPAASASTRQRPCGVHAASLLRLAAQELLELGLRRALRCRLGRVLASTAVKKPNAAPATPPTRCAICEIWSERNDADDLAAHVDDRDRDERQRDFAAAHVRHRREQDHHEHDAARAEQEAARRTRGSRAR